jgi:bifunctional non-homologous end joining protein LigD
VIEISHPDKVLFPRARVTKRDLAEHYRRVAALMLPHVRGRALALEAFPDGVERSGFFMKSVPRHFPDWVHRATLSKRGGTITHVVADDARTLVYLAGQNVVTLHTWLSRADEPRRPDRLIIDLDPSGARFAEVRAAARAAGDRLRDAGLVPFAMTTGSRGIHVVCPLRRGPTFPAVHRFARALAEEMVRADPRRLTLEWHRAERGERIYLDVNRINYAQHAVAPYAVRSQPSAPVAVPLRWEELSDRRLDPQRWTVKSLPERIRDGDPWRGISRRARDLPDQAPEGEAAARG